MRREKSAIILNQDNNSQSSKMVLNAGKVFSMDQKKKGDWAEILLITLVTFISIK